jgi:hypothetical protein
MESFFEKLNKAKREVRFELEQKEALKKRLLQYIEAERLVREQKLTRQDIIQRSAVGIVPKPMTILAVIVIAALVGGGTSFAAQNALPGDLLYPVKVNVNEKITLAFKASAKAKAEYEADLAARRLEEAAELAAESRLNAEARTQVESRFQAFADRVEARIDALRAEGNVQGAADVASRFETALRAHEQILTRFEARGGDVAVEVRPLGTAVRGVLNLVVGARTELESDVAASENKAEVKVAAEGKVNAAENVIASTEAFIESRKAKLGAEAAAEAEARLQAAGDLVVQAKTKVQAEAYGEAFTLASQAIRVAQEARALVEARTELNVDVNLGPLKLESEGSGEMQSGAGASEEGNMQRGTKGSGEVKLKVEF